MIATIPHSAIRPEDSTLLQYEALRSRVLIKPAILNQRGLGLALFIRQGMLAWIEICQRCIPATANHEKWRKTPALAYETTSEMIKVMANITLCNIEEALS
jgi:hypothetical protein